MDLPEVGGMDLTDLAKEWDRWQALMNMVMNVWVLP
jgi:hypothetical protein